MKKCFLKILIIVFPVVWGSCAHTGYVQVQKIFSAKYEDVPVEIPIEVIPANMINQYSYQKLALLEITDDHEYYNNIQKEFRLNAVEKFKEIARSIGAQAIYLLDLQVQENVHHPGYYQVNDRFGKKIRVYKKRPFTTFKYKIQAVAIRYLGSHPGNNE